MSMTLTITTVAIATEVVARLWATHVIEATSGEERTTAFISRERRVTTVHAQNQARRLVEKIRTTLLKELKKTGANHLRVTCKLLSDIYLLCLLFIYPPFSKYFTFVMSVLGWSQIIHRKGQTTLCQEVLTTIRTPDRHLPALEPRHS